MPDIFNGAPPQSVTGAVSSVTGMPDWYQEYLRGIAAQGTQAAAVGYQQYPGQQLAGFTPDQLSGFGLAEGQVGQWQPFMQNAANAAKQILPTTSAFLDQSTQYGADATGLAKGFGNNAVAAAANSGSAPLAAQGAQNLANNMVAAPSANWSDNWKKYMSPYTSSVVDEIGRLGNKNLQENILAPTMDSFIGSGGFGSDRNADMIGRNIRDAQTNISGLQSQALQSGYQQAGSLFNQDAGRQQQQQQLQANTALQGGQLNTGALQNYAQLLANTNLSAGTLDANTYTQAGQLANNAGQIGATAADSSAQRYGALGQLQQQLGYQDAGALGTVGGAQQQLAQQGMDLGVNNFNTQQNWNWNQLNNLSSLVRGMQLPTSTTQVSNQPYGNVGTSPLQWATSLYGLGNANGSNNGSSMQAQPGN